MIEFRAVTREFVTPQGARVVAVRDLSFIIGEGETFCLIGPSGCGKTTTLRLINRLLDPTRGEVLVAGHDIRERDPIALRRGIGYVTQAGGLFPHMTVATNIGLLCELEGWSAERIRARVDELLELVSLAPSEYRDRYPRDLSGGQAQRVGVARALALDPPTILMDEPFGALDPITRGQLQQEFLTLSESMAKTIVIVTHDLAEAFLLGDRIGLQQEGELVQVGTEQDFRERPANDFVAEFVRGQASGETSEASSRPGGTS